MQRLLGQQTGGRVEILGDSENQLLTQDLTRLSLDAVSDRIHHRHLVAENLKSDLGVHLIPHSKNTAFCDVTSRLY